MKDSIESLKARVAQLESEKKSLENIISVIPCNIFWKDKEGCYQGCNNALADVFGFKHWTEIIGTTIKDLAPEHAATALERSDHEIMTKGIHLVLEEEGEDAAGNRAIYHSHKVPLKDETGEVTGLLGVSLDITRRKELELALLEAKEKAEAANRAKEEFLCNMRHDIRTPFSGILGVAQLLESKEMNPVHKEYLQCIVESSTQLLDYLNQILEFMQMESKNVPVMHERFCMKKLLDQCVSIIRPTAVSKRLDIHVSMDDRLMNNIITDPFRLQRILINLMSNSVKFTHHGFVEVGAEILNQAEGSTLVRVWVKDTGIGIPHDKFNDIFEEFFRLSSSYEGEYPGSGLGLKAVKQLTEDLSGEISVDSEVGHGSIFTCLIPIEFAA